MKEEQIKKVVKEGYARIARERNSCCGGEVSKKDSQQIGYSMEELDAVPEGANLGLGCGNPVALASLREGEVVLDFGCGAGLDCFLAAKKVGKTGQVIGVDMTPEMIQAATENARKGGYTNVQFRLGEIENLPVADNTVDVVISNCVINLIPDKKKAFKEAFRVLKPGGRLMISDIVLTKELPEIIKKSAEAYVGCLSGAILRDDYLWTIRDAGFQQVMVLEESPFPLDCLTGDPTAQGIIKTSNLPMEKIKEFSDSILSIKVMAVTPNRLLYGR